MNSILENELPETEELRDYLLDVLTDQDLAYKLPGNNMTLGELCLEMGLTQQIYTQSFKTLRQDWAYQGYKPEAPNSVASFKTWFKKLDAELIEAVAALSEDDVQNKQIDRGNGFTPSPLVQSQVYHEALLIFYAKASIYMRALDKKFSDQWQIGIG